MKLQPSITIGFASLLLFLLLLPADAAPPQVMRGHVPAGVAGLKAVGDYAGTNHLNLAIGLPLRNKEALTNLLRQIYDPASTNYHHYLTPEQFTRRFGPTEKDYRAVTAFAKAHGLRVTGTHPNRMLVDVSGSVADIQKALHVTMRVYQHPKEARNFYAPDVEPSLDLSIPVLSIGGLDNYSLPQPRLVATPLVNGQSVTPNAGSGPSGNYMGNDFRTAYAPGVTLTGSGQIVGLLQFDGYTASDITYYESQAGLPSVTLSNVLIDGASGNPSGGGGEVEVSLDIEMAISMAPGLSGVMVYMAPNPSPWEDLLNRMATDNMAKQLSCSWYQPGGAAKPTCDQIFQQMAAQGQSFFNASGDYDAYTGLIDFPGDTPYLTQVGGTTLSTAVPGGPWTSETVWNRGNGIGSGGGISTQYPIPSWQTNISMTANQGSTTKRNTPDVALTAENVYVRANGRNYNVGGTSCSAPLWAGFAALVNQQAVASGKPTVGFINPAVDTIGSGPKFTTSFHDITTGNNTSGRSPGKFYAVTGYDLCTGWGTPAGQGLIDALANPEALLITPATGFASTGGVGGPFTITSQSLSLTNAGTNSLTWTLANTSVWVNASPGGGTLAPGETAATVTVSLNAAASNLLVGTYNATVWFTNLNSRVGQGRQFTLAVISPPTITAQPADQAVLEGAAATFIVTATGGLPLSYQWQDNGTNLSDNGNVSGSTTPHLTISHVSPADVGFYSVAITNFAGMAGSSNALLTITPSPPVIILQPANQTAVVGGAVTFTVAVIGSTPFFYQWSFNGTNISGATNATLTLANVQLNQAGGYAVEVSNLLGSATSTNAILAVYTVPVISSFGPQSGAAGEVVNVSGLNFDPTPGNNLVYFGAVRATVNAASVTNLEVTVPAGATYAPVTVTVNGLVAYSGAAFLPTFAGNGTVIGPSTFGARLDLSSPNGPIHTAIGDLDGDGRPDLVLGSAYDHVISIYQNQSTNGPLTTNSFGARVDLPVIGGSSDNPYGLLAADVDGDGKLDIVACDRVNDQILVYRNLSGGGTLTAESFAAPVAFGVGADPRYVRVVDLDGDGRSDMVCGSYAGNVVSILQNVGMAGSLTTNSFAVHVDLAAGAGARSVAVGDLDGDGRPDLAVANSEGASVSVYRNLMTGPGVINANSFAPQVQITASVGPMTIAIGDVDGDGKADLVTGSWGGQCMSVYRNLASPGVLATNSFATRIDFGVTGWAHNVALGDVNGDGKPDVALVAEVNSAMSVFQNLSTPGSFTNTSLGGRVDYATGWNPWGISVGDLDGDGRPEIVFGNCYDSTMSIYQNITPFGGPPAITTQPASRTNVVGTTASFSVTASGTAPMSYQWAFNGTNIDGAINTTLTLTNVQFSQAGNYAVLVTNLYGSILSSNAILTVIPSGSCTPTPSGLAVWWPGQGDAHDVAGTNDGTLVNGVIFTTGMVGQAFSFDGTSYVSIPNAPLLNTFVSSITIEAWIKVNQFPSGYWTAIVGKGDSSWQLLRDSNTSRVGFCLTGTSNRELAGNKNVDDGQWHHVAGVYDGTNQYLYVDGALDASIPCTGSISQNSYPVCIGENAQNTGRRWNGLIDEVSIYNRALTASEIQAIYIADGNGKCPLTSPVIVSQPTNQTVAVGGTTTFNVTASGTPPISYQWNFNGTNINGATNAILTLTNVQLNQKGNYAVLVTNAYGSILSSNAVLTVVFPSTPDSFNPGANAGVFCTAVQADGKIVVGGEFTMLGGQSCSYIGRLNADGTLDTDFNPGADNIVYSLAVQTDGKILVGGNFTTLGGQSRAYLGRLNGDGTLDTGFNPGANSLITTLAVQADGKILVGGDFTMLGGQSRSYIGRLDGNGALDTGFNPGANNLITTLAVQADGKILVGGDFTTLGSQGCSYLGRLDGNGALDTGFNPGANSFITTLAVQADGKILVGGWFTALGGQSRSYLGRLNANGTLDTGFNPGANSSVFSLAVQADGKILVGGDFTALGGQSCYFIGRLNADGTPDTGFDPGANSDVYSLAVQADGKILVGGDFNALCDQSRSYLGRLTPTGPAIQSLVFDGSTITWQRGGSSPEVWRTFFEGTTNGSSWIALGAGARITGGWQLSGLAWPTNASLRARGFVVGGCFNGSGWFVEMISGSPVIVNQPANQTVTVSGTATFSVTAGGALPLSYQWNFNGTNIDEATNSSLVLVNVQLSQAGNYAVLVTNVYDSVLSSNAVLTVNPALSGVPVIISISPQAGEVGVAVNVSGLNFDPTPGNNLVYFGAVRAMVNAASATNLEVTVPSGATYAPVTVTVNGLVAYSVTSFLPTFAGNGTVIGPSTFGARLDLGSPNGPIHTAIGDLNGDGKPDLVLGSAYDHVISIYQNQSTNGPLTTNSFGARVDLPVIGGSSDNPYGLLAADVDGDGKLDIVACDRVNDQILVYRNLSGGGVLTAESFAAPVAFGVGADPRYVRVVDLDGDGRPDMVCGSTGGNVVSILQNVGVAGSLTTNSFAAHVDLAAGAGTRDVAVGDLDGDGRPDVAAVNADGSSISIYRNLMSGPGVINANSFTPQVQIAAPDSPLSIAIRDVDGDGKADLVIGSWDGQSISVYRNLASPGVLATNSFATRIDFGVTGWAHNVALGDVNGDGKPDVALVAELNSAMSVFQNLSTPGSFTNTSLGGRVDYATGWNPWGISVGDLDGDGRPEVVFGNCYDSTISIYQNITPFGGEPPTITAQPTNQTVDVGATASFSVTASGPPPLSYQWNFNGTNILGATSTTLTLTNVQISQAGNYAVLVTNQFGSVLSSNAVLTVNPPLPGVPVIAGFNPISGVVGANVTLFGTNFSAVPSNNIVYFGAVRAAVIAASATNLVVIMPTGATFAPITETVNGLTAYANKAFEPTFLGDGSGISSSSFAPRVDLACGNGPFVSVIADLDGDGKPDLVAANYYGDNISLFRNISTNGSLTTNSFAPRVDLPSLGGAPLGLAAGDVDGDGKLDLVVSDSSNNRVLVYRNISAVGTLTTNSFALPVAFSVGSSPISVRVGDLDGDGKSDLACVCYGNNTVSILRNVGTTGSLTTNSFAPQVTLATGTRPYDLVMADVDGDGRLDLVQLNYASYFFSVFRNVSVSGVIDTNSFAARVDFATSGEGNSIMAGDVDGDGKTDVMVGLATGTAVSVYRNLTSPGTLDTNSFAAKVNFPAPGFVRGEAMGDLSGNGKPDISLVGESGNFMSVYQNLSTPGSFTNTSLASRVDYSTGSNPHNVTMGDLDGDGRPDIIFVNQYSGTISIYRNVMPLGGRPIIAAQPTNQTVVMGGTAAFNVTASGTPPLRYQWNFNGTNIAGATNTTLMLTNVQLSQAGNYAVLVTNAYGSVLSSNAGLAVMAPPVIVIQPTNQTVLAGATVSFTVGASGTPPLTYRWRFNGTNIIGATNTTLTLTNVQVSQAGNYAVLVTNLYGSALSSNAVLTVGVPPSITTQPTNQMVLAGGTASFSVTAVGAAPLRYQWNFRGTNLAGATNTTLSLTNVQLSLAGNYAVRVTNQFGSVLSSNAVLTVNPAPPAVPVITGFNPISGIVGTTVTLFGINFSAVPSNNIVYFGAVRAAVTGASTTNLLVTVPVGAVFAPITVTVNGLTAYANSPFLVTFLGSGVINPSSLTSRADLASSSGPDAVVIADLDGDGQPDLAVNNYYDGILSIYRNISTNGSLTINSFAPRVDIATGAGTPFGMVAADVDGDGKLDLVLEDPTANQALVLMNLSTPGNLTTNSFGAPVRFAVGSSPSGVAVQDLDGDGKPEIVTANYGGTTVSVLRNIGTPGSITTNSFAPAASFTVGPVPVNVMIADVDGDGKADLVTVNNSSSSKAMSVLRNLSTLGNIAFATNVDFPGLSTSYSLAMGDLDGDGKPDVVIGSQPGGQAISVYRNMSTPGSITTNSFAAHVDFATGGWANTVAIGDLDGDGRLDVAVGTQSSSHLSLFKNASTPGSFTTNSFAARVDFSAGSNVNGVAIGDLDGDGRPDIVFANQYSDTVSLYRNIIPLGSPLVITAQPTNQTVTAGGTATFNVTASGTPPLRYQWRFNGTNVTGATNTTLTLTNVQLGQAGNYAVLVTNFYGSVLSSNAVLTVVVPSTPDSFNPGANGDVYCMAVQADGKIVVGGNFTVLGGQSCYWLGRLNADGTLDTGFNPGVNYFVNSLVVQADGKIVVSGYFTMLGGQSRTNIGRLNADGTLDAGFNPGANDFVNSLAMQADGKILVGGYFTALGGQSCSYVGRLNADGTLDTNFNPNANSYVYSLAVQADGKILMGGWFSALGGQSRAQIGRLNADGTLDTSFNPGAGGGVYSMVVQADGKIVVGGFFTTLGGQSRTNIGRLNSNGALDTSFNPGVNGNVGSMAMQTDGKILVGGQFTMLGGQSRTNIGRLNADGTLDAGFNSGANGRVISLAMQADGKILVGGDFTTLDGQSRNRIGRLTPTEPATQNLTFHGSTIVWLRGGSSPEVWRTTFDGSTNGVSWVSLGAGTRVTGGWQLSGLAWPTNASLRARGFVTGGGYNGSDWFVETMVNPPVITNQPASQTVGLGGTAMFNVGAGSFVPLCYQWNFNGTNIAGATNASLTLTNVQLGQAGNYAVLVTNLYGSVLSSNALLTVNPAPPAVPVITGFNPISGVVGTNVTLFGTNFSAVPSNNVVYFGAVRATVIAASATNLVVIMPPGATYAPITETVNGLTAYAPAAFEPTFFGDGSGISTADFAERMDLACGNGPYLTAIADLDGDGKPDVVALNYYGSNISLFRNISTNSTLSFAPRVDLPSFSGGPFGLVAADVDGDGKFDLVVSDANNSRVMVYRNTAAVGTLTTNSFAAPVYLAAGNNMRRLAVQDLNADGKPEIVTANNGGNTISIFQNHSTMGNVSFASRVDYAAGAGPHGLAIGDLDGDGKPDLAVANYDNGSVSVFRNLGSGGVITNNSFAGRVDFAAGVEPADVVIGDLDGDGKPDMMVANYDSGTVSVFRNLGAGGGITTNSFAAKVDYSLDGVGHTVALGDLDGDGKPDLAAVTEGSDLLSLFNNASTPGSFTTNSLASRVDFSAGSNPWGVKVGDLNGDGRPDIIFANQYSGTISIYRNVMPLGGVPIITVQPTNQAVAAGGTAIFSVTAAGTRPLRCQWNFNGTNMVGATNMTLALTDVRIRQAGNYCVVVTNVYGSATSTVATLSVGFSPKIVSQPENQYVSPGCDATFEVCAWGTPPLSCQWWKDGSALNGQTNLSLMLTNVQTSDFGSFSVVVTSGFGSVTSSPAQLALGHPPVASADAIYRFASGGVRVAASGLLTNDMDPDGDALTIIGVSPTSTAGGTVGFTNNWVYYAPPGGPVNGDTFTYTVSDGHCGTDVGTVTVQIKADNQQPLALAIANPGDGSIRLTFDGMPECNYRIEYTDDLFNPVWQTLTTRTVDCFGVCHLADGSLTNAPVRFYRAVWP